MPLRGDLGPSAAALLVLLFAPVLAFVVRRRWRLAVARREEVRRLALLAAQEASWAEVEAMEAYAAAWTSAAVAAKGVTKDPSARPECPVCFCPAIARCARCKAVRYCSGKCQIVHWRQGHKDECHPPPVNDNYNGVTSVSCSKVVQAEQPGLEHKEDLNMKAVEMSFERAAASESCFSPDDLNEDDVYVPGKEKTSDSFALPSIPIYSTVSYGIGTPDDALASGKPHLLHNARLEKSSSSEIPTTSVRKAVNNNDANLTSFSTSKLSTSSPLVNGTFSSNIKEMAFTSKTVVDESVLSGPSGLKATASLDHTSNKHSEITGEDQIASPWTVHDETYIGVGSTSEISSHVSASSKAKSQSENKKMQASNKEESGSVANGMKTEVQSLKSKACRPLASASDQLSSNGGAHPVAIHKTSKIGNASREPIRLSDSSGAIANGLSKYAKRLVKQSTSPKVSRHYPLEPMLFPYDLFIKLYNSDNIELRPCGLINCGNSCYANAVLQCLAFTRPLTAYLLEGLHSKRCPKKDWCFTCEFESLVMNTKQGKSPLSPIGILSHLHNIGSNFGHGKEEDAHEFLRYAIDIMQSVCLKEAGAKPDDVLAEETTLIQQTFGGYLQSKIRCYRCKSNSERCERMMDLTVEIHGDIATLDEALSCFTSPEILDGKNKYECDRCKSREQARKRLSILEAPNVLTIVLKRFQSGKYGKLNKAVRFPEYLNLAHYMSGDDASSMYQLYAVIVHKDVMNASFSGHYVCYVKDTQGKWYKIDDSEVKPVELKKVLSKSAYMLLYARCSPHAPSLVRKAISHDPLQARKIRSKEASGKSGGSSITEQRSHFYPQPMMGDRANFQSSDLFRPPLNDSSSDNSSLFDEGSSCSTESTRDSASTEENWECMSGESDCINSNSLRGSKESNGLTHSPLFSRHSSKKVLHDDSGRNASSSGREIDHVEVGRLAPMKHQGGRTTCSEGSKSSSFLYHDKSQTCRVTEHCSTVETDWINPSEVKSGVVLRRPSREITAQTFY
ncbi:unnamed protein product [Musa acuminata subsp. burmannicoides]